MTIKIRRGDLVAIEIRSTYAQQSPGENVRTEIIEQIKIYTVTNLTRAGEIAKVKDIRYGEDGYALPLNRILHRTGRWWLLPQTGWDTARVKELVQQHTYPNSDYPRPFPSLDAAREWLHPARLMASGNGE